MPNTARSRQMRSGSHDQTKVGFRDRLTSAGHGLYLLLKRTLGKKNPAFNHDELTASRFDMMALVTNLREDMALFDDAFKHGDQKMVPLLETMMSKLLDAVEQVPTTSSRMHDLLMNIYGRELVEYLVLLDHHDWSYHLSNDPGVLDRGDQNLARLKAIAETKGGMYMQAWKWFNNPKVEA